MTVAELIEALKGLPQDAEVKHVWDGCARTDIHHVYLTKGGFVATADNDEVVYHDAYRPVDAPDEAAQRYWYTPGEKP